MRQARTFKEVKEYMNTRYMEFIEEIKDKGCIVQYYRDKYSCCGVNLQYIIGYNFYVYQYIGNDGHSIAIVRRKYNGSNNSNRCR